MANRTLAVAVAVAVVAGATVAAIGLATRGSSKGSRTALTVDEQAGRVGPIVLGETYADVLAVLGRPRSRERETLAYAHLSIGLAAGRVSRISTDDPTARTLKAVGIGDALGAVRAAYRKAATCEKLPEKETEGGTGSSSSFCTVRVPAGKLRVSGDPIESFTLSRR